MGNNPELKLLSVDGLLSKLPPEYECDSVYSADVAEYWGNGSKNLTFFRGRDSDVRVNSSINYEIMRDDGYSNIFGLNSETHVADLAVQTGSAIRNESVYFEAMQLLTRDTLVFPEGTLPARSSIHVVRYADDRGKINVDRVDGVGFNFWFFGRRSASFEHLMPTSDFIHQ